MTQQSIAIAGGTGTIGSSIVTALMDNPLYNPIILSRATETNPAGTTSIKLVTRPSTPSTETKVKTVYVDYTSITSLKHALQGITTLISTLLIPGPDFITSQLNLLHAAEEAGVRRFIPSEFALRQSVHADVDIDAAKIIVADAVRESVARGRIDAGFFPCGMFMNYLGIGIPDSRKRKEALAGFKEGGMIFYLDSSDDHGSEEGEDGRRKGPWIEVPLSETGEYPDLTMTDIRDVGRFIVAALGIREPWGGRELGMVGDTMNFREIMQIIQSVIGEKVEVRTVTQDELRARLNGLDEGDILGRMDVQYTIVCGRGGSVVQGVLNELCPDVKPIGIRGFMEKYWI
ncbi:hypothetical protein BJX99DRAFT_259310 [Aspergillus californicus]